MKVFVLTNDTTSTIERGQPHLLVLDARDMHPLPNLVGSTGKPISQQLSKFGEG
jgi:hypothetical protein